MDPDANIREQRRLAARIIERIDGPGAGFDREAQCEDGERLAELVQALDEWRLKGGHDPYTFGPNNPLARELRGGRAK